MYKYLIEILRVLSIIKLAFDDEELNINDLMAPRRKDLAQRVASQETFVRGDSVGGSIASVRAADARDSATPRMKGTRGV